MTKPTPQPEPRKRATPTPSDETAAIRAIRAIRQLDKQVELVRSKAQARVAELMVERKAIVDGLSEGSVEIAKTLGVVL